MPKLRHRPALFAALTALTIGACAEPEETKAGLILAVQTDMAVPKDVDQVRLKISMSGQVKYEVVHDVGEADLQLPATLTLLPPEDAGRPVTIEVVSFQNRKARTLRKVVTTVPDNREALLRLPIQWLSSGMVEEDVAEDADTGLAGATGESDATPQRVRAGERVVLDLRQLRPQQSQEPELEVEYLPYRSTCAKDDESAVAGTCVSNLIDSSKLPDYKGAEVFGGKTADSVATCFATLSCFSAYQVIAPSQFTPRESPSDPCELTLADLGSAAAEASLPQLNFAIATGASGDGICGTEEDAPCLVALDHVEIDDVDANTGWTWHDDGKSVRLPNGVCNLLEANDSYALVTSNACDTKTPKNPTCGPWSLVSGEDEGEPRPIAMPATGGSAGSGGSTSTGGAASGGVSATGGSTSSGGASTGGTASGGAPSGQYQHVSLIATDGTVAATSNPLGLSGFFIGEWDSATRSSSMLTTPANGIPSVSGTLDPMPGLAYAQLTFSTAERDIKDLGGFAYVVNANATLPLVFGVTIQDVAYCAPASSELSNIVPFANLIECVGTLARRPPSTGLLQSVFWRLDQQGTGSIGVYQFGLDELAALQIQ